MIPDEFPCISIIIELSRVESSRVEGWTRLATGSNGHTIRDQLHSMHWMLQVHVRALYLIPIQWCLTMHHNPSRGKPPISYASPSPAQYTSPMHITDVPSLTPTPFDVHQVDPPIPRLPRLFSFHFISPHDIYLPFWHRDHRITIHVFSALLNCRRVLCMFRPDSTIF